MIRWWPDALEDYARLSLSDAEAVARAVAAWDATATGYVVPFEGGVYQLFVGEHVVVFYVDGQTMNVAGVRRA